MKGMIPPMKAPMSKSGAPAKKQERPFDKKAEMAHEKQFPFGSKKEEAGESKGFEAKEKAAGIDEGKKKLAKVKADAAKARKV